MSAFLIVLAILLIVVNGFFVAAEFALVRSRRSRLEEIAEQEQSSGARQALTEVNRIDEYLSAAQVGITLASIGLGFIGQSVAATAFKPLFGNIVGQGLAVVLAIGVSYLLVTGAHVILGEQVPKMMAITRAEGTAKFISRPLEWFRLAFHPLIWTLNRASNFVVMRVFGIKIDVDQESATAEELRVLISRGAAGGKLDPGEAVMLSGVFHLHEQEARQVMTPIPAVVTVNADATAENALQRCVESGHTRLVVVEEDNPDKVKGIVHVNGLARGLMNDGPDAALEPLVRDALIMPETKPLDDLLADMQRQRTSLAVIVDEFGRTAGIVTIEDIIEEIVGEIVDETDPVLSSVRRLVNGDWFVRGHVSLDDLVDAGIELPIDSEAYTSVGGYVFTELGRLPKRGDVIDANGYQIRVESVRENRIEAVRIHRASEPTG